LQQNSRVWAKELGKEQVAFSLGRKDQDPELLVAAEIRWPEKRMIKTKSLSGKGSERQKKGAREKSPKESKQEGPKYETVKKYAISSGV